MIFFMEPGTVVNIPATRRLMNKKHFRFRVFKDQPLRFQVTLMPGWEKYNPNQMIALNNVEFVYMPKNSKPRRKARKKLCKVHKIK